MPIVADVSAPGLNVAIVKRKRPSYGWQPVPGGDRTVKLGRKPTPLEEKLLSLADIPPRLDAEVQHLADGLALLRRDAFDGHPPDSHEMVAATLSAIRATQQSVASYGAFEHRQEWSRQGVLLAHDVPGPDPVRDVHMRETALMRAERLCHEWTAALRELRHAYRRFKPGHTPSQFEAYADKWVSYGLPSTAKQVVNGAFAFGRQAENHRLVSLKAVDAETYVYTAVLDANTCSTCEEKDGTEFSPDDPDAEDLRVPSPECEGGPDRCRCMWVAVDSEPGWVDARNEHQRLIHAMRMVRHVG
jgi:hypothetical protein